MNSQASVTTILMLSSNPKGTSPLRLDEEKREIEAGIIERSQQRESFRLIKKDAVRTRDLQRAMLDLNPQIVHFSGHGGGEQGLAFEDESGQIKFVNAEALAGLFELFADQLRCVVLNACYSEEQAKAIADHVPYVIGMSSAIGDKAAIEFAVGFYDALGAGRDIEFAYKLGCSVIRLTGIPEHLTPILRKKHILEDIYSSKMTVPAIQLPIFTPGNTENLISLPNQKPQLQRHSIMLSTYNPETWVGRENHVTSLSNKLQGQCRLLMLTGLTGIGKTALAEYLANSILETNTHSHFRFFSFSFDGVQSPDFISLARQLLEQKLNILLLEEEKRDKFLLIQRLTQILKNGSYWLQLDSLEVLLLEDEQGRNSFIDKTWLEFFRYLFTTDCSSRCIITSQVLPEDLETIASRYSNFYYVQALSGLIENEQLDLFKKIFSSSLEINNLESLNYLKQIGRAYEGHPLVLQVVAGEILASPFQGNIKHYCQYYQTELAEVLQENTQAGHTNIRSRRLENQVKKRVRQSLTQLPEQARQMLYKSSVYRCPVPVTFWWAMLSEELSSHAAFNTLCERYLVEFEDFNGNSSLIRQHNLIRNIAYEMLRSDSTTWEAAERTAAQMWLNSHTPTDDVSNFENIRGYLEAFNHYCNLEDWEKAVTIPFIKINTNTQEMLHQSLGIWGYSQEQMKLYNTLLNIFIKSNNLRGQGFALGHLGNVYNDLGNYRQAMSYYQKHLIIVCELNLRNDEGIVLSNLGTVYQALGDYQAAVEYYQHALSIVQEVNDYSMEGTILNNLGGIYSNVGDYKQAIACHQQSLKLIAKINNSYDEQAALSGLGQVHYLLGNYDLAIEYYRQVLILVQEISDCKGEIQILSDLGLIYHAWGNYEQAIDYYQQGLILAQKVGDRQGEGVTLGNLGFALYCLNNYEQATEYCQQALKIAREIGNKQGEATTLSTLGRVFHSQEAYGQALEFHQQRLAICHQIGDRRGEGIAQMLLGFTLVSLKRYSDALKALLVALEICQNLGNKSEEAETLLFLAELYHHTGQVQLAQQCCEESLSISKQLRIPLLEKCIIFCNSLAKENVNIIKDT